MKFLFFAPIGLFFLCSFGDIGEQQSPESTPEYHVTGIKPDGNLPKGTGIIVFTFFSDRIAGKDSIRMSYNGIEKKVLPTKDGRVYLSVKGGKYKFQFFLDSDHYEVYTDSIEIKTLHQTSISVWFTNSTIPVMAEKPVIYVYPDQTQQVNIQLNVNGKLGFTYPTYNSGWDFTADPDGTIHMNGKQYDYLFWDGATNVNLDSEEQNTGFLVERDSLLHFFEEKLTAMGLNAREQEDFITYWCPRMQVREKYFVHFMFTEEYDEIATMHITPKPDHIFRVFMLWQDGTNMDVTRVTQQVIQPFTREGFTVVEWGGGMISEQVQ